MTHMLGDVHDAKLILDGDAGRESLRRIATRLRREPGPRDQPVFRTTMFVRKDEGNVLVQLADVVTSAVGRSYREDRRDRAAYRSVIAHRLRVYELGEGVA